MITVKNTGCGLGDMLGRIDLVYKISRKYSLEFFMPDISSNLHSKNYGDELGFNKYKPNRLNWVGPTSVLQLSEFLEWDKISDHFTGDRCLYEVSFDHSISNIVSDSLGLGIFDGFDYSKILPETSTEGMIEYLVHLRLGDNYLYRLNDDRYLDSGRRMLVRLSDPGVEKLISDQWKIHEVSAMVDYFESKGIRYRFISDGVQSAIRHVNWTKSDDYLIVKDELLESINQFNHDFCLKFGLNKNFYIGSDDVAFAIDSLRSSENVVCTVGGFMRHINKYLNFSKSKVIQFSDFVKRIK
jgi:hypothetical protein